MKKLIYQKRYLILGILGLIVLIGLASWYFRSKDPLKNSFSKKEKIWQTVEIETAKDFSSIKVPAKVKSNQFAIISPRRSGIIQDLLVDIGDEVYKGQTIGSMLPEGVEGQSSAAINEASARLQKARSELSNLKGVSIGAIAVARKQLNEGDIQSDTQINLEKETQKQLNEKKLEAVLIATQAWENIQVPLFGNRSNRNDSRNIQGSFLDSILKNNVENLATKIERMESSNEWNNSNKIIEHISHLENFLVQSEKLYKGAIEASSFTASQISNNLSTIQAQQLKISQIKQLVLNLEEKSKRFSSVQAEKQAGADKSREALELVESQQNLNTTQAERNVEVALANYNAALVKSGHQSVTSPFNGTISARMIEVGQAVTPNTALFYLEGAQTNRSKESLSEIHFNLPESWKEKVSIGENVVLRSIEGESFEGSIFRLSPQINLRTNSIMATAIAFEKTYEEIITENIEEEAVDSEKLEATLNDEEKEIQEIITPMNFAHGQSMFVYITNADSQIFTVPTLALKRRGNDYFVWRMENDSPVQIKIEIIAEDGESSQIFSREITSGDLIISNPSVSLFKKSS